MYAKPLKIIMKHKEFVDHYMMNGGNAADAVMKTNGYNFKNRDVARVYGYQLLQKKNVRRYLKQQQRNKTRRMDYAKDKYDQELLDALERSKGNDDKITPPILKLIGQSHGFLKDKVEVEQIVTAKSLFEKYKGGEEDACEEECSPDCDCNTEE